MFVEDPTLLAALLVGLVTFFILYFFLLGNIFNTLPPGPWGLPLIGYWPWMSEFWHMDFSKLGKVYGDVFTVYLLNSPILVLNSWKAVEEALIHNAPVWAGRPFSHGFKLHELNPANLGKDDYTKELRARKKFGMAALKKIAFGMPNVQEMIFDDIDTTIQTFKDRKQKAFMLQEYFWVQGANPIIVILFGRRYAPDDKEIINVFKDTEIWFNEMTPVCQADCIPILRFFPRTCVRKGREATRRLKRWFQDVITEHRKEHDPDDLKSFVDICIQNGIDDEEILNYIFAFWGDSVSTTPGTIRWWIYFMAHYPECQAKCQAEVDRVLEGRRPESKHKYDLPYLEASQMEALRCVTPVPVSMPLKTVEDTQLLGYRIPKGTVYFANWHALHTDPELFENPYVYMPERYILEDGRCDTKKKGWAGFAIGKRNCIGEPLARQVMFPFCASLMQNFTFSFPENEIPSRNPSDMAIPGVTNMAEDFKIIATPRKLDN